MNIDWSIRSTCSDEMNKYFEVGVAIGMDRLLDC